jgi:hypothetical protein
MKTRSKRQFLKWALKHDIGLDCKYPDSAVLAFHPSRDLDRFWRIPPQPEHRPYMLCLMLDRMGDWQSCFVWRHMGSWPFRPNPQDINSRVKFQIHRGTGLPMGTDKIVQFKISEIDQLATLLFSTSVFGEAVGDDLYIVPDHGRYIMKMDHHDVVHVSFKDETLLHDFVNEMEAEEFPLPTAVPDPTFKTPDWMKPEQNEESDNE